MKLFSFTAALLLALTAPVFAKQRHVSVRHQPGAREVASCYGEGRHTASGERFNKHALTAARPAWAWGNAFGTRLKVTNKDNGRSVVVRINDRGPFVRGRTIDLATAACKVIGLIHRGVGPVSIERI